MTAPHHQLRLVPNRVAAAVRRLEAAIWRRERMLAVQTAEARPDHVDFAAGTRQALRPLDAGSAWGRLFDQAWRRMELPSGEDNWLEWRDQGEATLYIDGTPYYGFDVAHRRCKLPAEGGDAWVESLCAQTAIWHADATGISPAGSVFEGAWLVHRDDLAWRAYHDLECLAELMLTLRPEGPVLSPFGYQPPVDGTDPFYRRLLRLLDQAVDALDRQGMAAMCDHMETVYRELADDKPSTRAVLTGHAHIDPVWLWPERMGEAKAVHTFATANRLMNSYPEFRFAHSQPASYEAVARRAPELHEAVRRRIAAGQWEATGVLYVESDTLLPHGEALARSALVGLDAFFNLREDVSRVVWLPDAFGYSACLPQIMKLAGVEYFFTSKVSWSALNRFPLSSFVWRGHDGSEVLAHVIRDVGYNGTVAPAELKKVAAAHVQSDVHPEHLTPTGFGDGGGGVTETMCERARRLASIRTLPAVSWDHPEAFFDRLAEKRADLPVYHGELYLEYHRGTYTTQGAVKAAFRTLERTLQTAEAVAVATGAAADLDAVWRRMIFAQFHDYVPGSAIGEVYAEGVPELGRLAEETRTGAIAALASGGEPCLFNPLPMPRTLVIGGELFRLPPLAGATRSEARIADPVLVEAENGRLSNGRIEVKLDGQGELLSVTVDGEPLDLIPGASGLVLYPDRPAEFEAWDIDRQALTLGEKVSSPAVIKVERDPSGLTAALAVTRTLGRASTVTIRYRLDSASPILRIEIDLDWREPEHLLKFHFRTGYRGGQVRHGAPFGSVLRPQQPGPAQAEAMWETPASRWIAGGDDGAGAGMLVVTEAKYGVSCRDGDWGISLVRSPRMPGFEAHAAAHPAALSRHRPQEIYSDIGHHRIALAIGRHDPDAGREEQPAALADLLFTPALPYEGAPVSSGLVALEGGSSLIPCWAKPVGNGRWILRLHETGGRRGAARLVLAPGWNARPVDLRERPVDEGFENGVVRFRPYQVISLMIEKGAVA